MIYLIYGASHTGKTLLAQKLIEKTLFPSFSIDHLKMGLIRSNNTKLTVYDDEQLVDYLWPIVVEMIKTAIENNQNLIIEGLYVPNNWKDSFSDDYLEHIKSICLIMSEKYLLNNKENLINYQSVIENRLESDFDFESLIVDNLLNLNEHKKNNYPYYLIDDVYNMEDIIGAV